MSLNDWKWIFIVLTLFGLIVLLRNIITEENWKYSVVSAALDEVQYGNQSSNLTRSLPAFYPNHSYCPHQGLPMSLEEQLEERNLLDSIIWPYPPSGSELLNLSQTSDPAHSLFTIVPSQKDQQWHVGDQLEVQIHLHDYEGRPKRYGGDFLLARLQSPHCRAGVVGQVLDHKNGVYSARLPLLWEGSTQVEVMMVHSSEAIAVLWRLREKRPDRVYFTGNFRRGRLSETTVCNMCFLLQDKGPRCNFTDLQTGEPWYCYTPKKLSCEDRISHAKGGYLKGIITSKEALLFQRCGVRRMALKNVSDMVGWSPTKLSGFDLCTNQMYAMQPLFDLSGVNIKVRINAATTDTIDVLPSRTSEERKEDPVTSGYYYRVFDQQAGLLVRGLHHAPVVRLPHLCASRIERIRVQTKKRGALNGGGQHPQHSGPLPLPRPTHPLRHSHGQRVALHRQRAGRPDRRSGHGGRHQHLVPLQHLSRGGLHATPEANPQGSGATPEPVAGNGGDCPHGQPSDSEK
ncbi:NXPE family member 3-like isoform X3 [Syngnathus acus]|uniref:NXPE family member 3-like isoform X3 n=1 Tax=Syngnathus acus TaxID=161584 RepID=UPI0018864D66|nr:NXPE family member 3-like isoform X3 [Syngnathus acus]